MILYGDSCEWKMASSFQFVFVKKNFILPLPSSPLPKILSMAIESTKSLTIELHQIGNRASN